MSRLFCVSDIHSHFTPLKKALDEAGFCENVDFRLYVSPEECYERPIVL